jgi:hypothetical protein
MRLNAVVHCVFKSLHTTPIWASNSSPDWSTILWMWVWVPSREHLTDEKGTQTHASVSPALHLKGGFNQGPCWIEDLSTIRCENTSQCGRGEKGRHGNNGERNQHPHRGRIYGRQSRPSPTTSSRRPRIPICVCEGSATRSGSREVVAKLGLEVNSPSNQRQHQFKGDWILDSLPPLERCVMQFISLIIALEVHRT